MNLSILWSGSYSCHVYDVEIISHGLYMLLQYFIRSHCNSNDFTWIYKWPALQTP